MAGTVRVDRRIRKTKQRLEEALNELILEKGYDQITVQDLIDRADVGRSTFYAHYETKDDLLISQTVQLQEEISRALNGDRPLTGTVIGTRSLFQHLAEHHAQFKAMIGSRGIRMVTEACYDSLRSEITEELNRRSARGERHAVPADARAAFLAGSLLTFATWWLDQGMPYSSEQVDNMFQQLTLRA